MLLNTSLNIKGQPIFNTWDDARFSRETNVAVFSWGIDNNPLLLILMIWITVDRHILYQDGDNQRKV